MKKSYLLSKIRNLSLALLLGIGAVLCSCHTRYVAMPEIHQRDSLRVIDTHRYDSIRLAEWHFLFQRGDTVFKTDSVIKEKIVEVEVHDTVIKNTRDSVPYPVEVMCPSRRTPLSPFHRGDAPRFYIRCTIAFFLLLLAIIAYIAARLYLW